MRSYPDMKYDFFSAMDMTKEELLHRLNNIDPVTTGVLFSSWFNKSHYAGSTLLTTNSFQDITNVSVPVFALQQASMNNNGIIGGYFYDKQTFQSWLQQTYNANLCTPTMPAGISVITSWGLRYGFALHWRTLRTPPVAVIFSIFARQYP